MLSIINVGLLYIRRTVLLNARLARFTNRAKSIFSPVLKSGYLNDVIRGRITNRAEEFFSPFHEQGQIFYFCLKFKK